MKYIKVEITTNTLGSELIADLLNGFTDSGVVINDAKDYNDAVKNSIYYNSEDIKPINNDDVIVTAYLDKDKADNAIAVINESLVDYDKDIFGALTVKISDYESIDYDKEWKSFHHPIEFKNFIIIPLWDENIYVKKTIKLNIGSSFGTGQHESTMLALQMIDDMDLTGKKVVDLGCGSGILGIAALIKGAESAYMCDIEPIDEVIENTKINYMAEKAIIKQQDLLQCFAKGDLVIANIYATVSSNYKEKIKSLVNDNGILILSGLYKDGADLVKKAYKEMQIIREERTGDWTALILKA